MLRIKLYQMSQELLNLGDPEFFWPYDIFKPDYLDREYADRELITMMEAMEPHSHFVREEDEDQIITNDPFDDEVHDEQYLNVIVPTSLKDVLGLDLNSTVDICLRDDCRMMFRARIVAFMNKVPMFWDMRSFRPNAFSAPGVIITESQMQYLLKQYFAKFPDEKERMSEFLVNGNLPNSRLAMKIDPEATSL